MTKEFSMSDVGIWLMVIGVIVVVVGAISGSENGGLVALIGLIVAIIGVVELAGIFTMSFAVIGGGFGLAIVRQKRQCTRKSANWCIEHPQDAYCRKQNQK